MRQIHQAIKLRDTFQHRYPDFPVDIFQPSQPRSVRLRYMLLVEIVCDITREKNGTLDTYERIGRVARGRYETLMWDPFFQKVCAYHTLVLEPKPIWVPQRVHDLKNIFLRQYPKFDPRNLNHTGSLWSNDAEFRLIIYVNKKDPLLQQEGFINHWGKYVQIREER